MDKYSITTMLTRKIKLVRIEYGYTQERMAEVLGISKKTLVQLEKERCVASWPAVVSLCVLFRDSDIIRHCLGGDPVELVETIAHQ
ncbi:helix-turn-helix transcriptional regulator [Pontibacillus litoralis]|uniref:helix-turn-helix transcriptional regulator n=1 Tax=Pontibacillus litoralis TaxID=516703 RepID=UPI00068CC968|nr:helix-turn-helix domain-containing protein [Pontibacillus litoralis]